jgi:adenylosuccinate synthase
MRNNSFAIEGGAFGDEGKGRVVDEICSRLKEQHDKLIVYRWNGGSNAGHTVVVANNKFVLHQLPSGVTIKGAIAILGKGMVIHPRDLVAEIDLVKRLTKGKTPAELVIDEMAVLTLDTHRVFESALKGWEEGGAGSTGRGIAPAYSDVILRHPVRVRDLISKDWKKRLGNHYELYNAFVSGLGEKINEREVKRLGKESEKIGSKSAFIKNLEKDRGVLKDYVKDATEIVKDHWESDTPFVFEGAQGVGLDPRWGVYPDVTTSDPTFSGIGHSTGGIVNPNDIKIRAAVYKATYMSSVGKRVLPTKMEEKLVERIRKDSQEYGATTGRPRDIYHIDIPALKYFARVSGATHMVLTHLDIAYKETPIKVCTSYKNKGRKEFDYRPDQEYLNSVKPKYKKLDTWDGREVRGARNIQNLPREAVQYIYYMAYSLGLVPLMVTTGPERSAFIDLGL